ASSPGSPPLSVDDLAGFFEPHHLAMAGRLRAAAPALEAQGHDAAGLGRALGEDHGLYDLVLGDPLDVRALCLVREMLGWASPTADGIYAVQGLALRPLLLAG